MNDNQKETLKFIYQFLHDLADPDSRLHMSTEDLAESADKIKDRVEYNFGTDVLGVPLHDNSVKGIVFTEQERNFCIDALNEHLLHWRRKDMLKDSEIKVLEVLIDDFKGPRWEESQYHQRILKKNARNRKQETLKRRAKNTRNALELEGRDIGVEDE